MSKLEKWSLIQYNDDFIGREVNVIKSILILKSILHAILNFLKVVIYCIAVPVCAFIILLITKHLNINWGLVMIGILVIVTILATLSLIYLNFKEHYIKSLENYNKGESDFIVEYQITKTYKKRITAKHKDLIKNTLIEEISIKEDTDKLKIKYIRKI